MSIFCGEVEYDEEDGSKDTATNPAMLFEVLSESTGTHDRGAKSAQYREIESLKAYALISQNHVQVEHFERNSNGSWTMTEAKGLDARSKLTVLGFDVRLSDLYAGAEPPQFSILREG